MTDRLRAVSLAKAISEQAHDPFPFRPNWIDYRHSLVVADRRTDSGETVEVCGSCGCEVDVVPAPHSPKCAGARGAA